MPHGLMPNVSWLRRCSTRSRTGPQKEKEPGATVPGSLCPFPLLHVGRGARFLQTCDSFLGVRLADVLEYRLGRRVDQVLGLLQAELGQLTDRLDDVDLALADCRHGDGG